MILRSIVGIARHGEYSILHNNGANMLFFCSSYSSASLNSDAESRDPFPVFMLPDVQSTLKSITGLDLRKIARFCLSPSMERPKYKLLTDGELRQALTDAERCIQHRLQMPPFMRPRESVRDPVLARNPELSGLDEHKHVFTDISHLAPLRHRSMVVREPDGTMRKASWEERDRINQVYNPIPGRLLQHPPMFDEDHLEEMLKKEKYLYILDCACVQFEPDDPEYVRVTHRTYKEVDAMRKHDELRCTRHFGPCAFYLAWYRKVEYLLIDMLARNLIQHAADFVHMYCVIHPECTAAWQLITSPQELEPLGVVKVFVGAVEARDKGRLKLELQAYEERLGVAYESPSAQVAVVQ